MNSTNIKVISEEIQRLKNKVHDIDIEVPDPSEATDGQILSVEDGEYVISDPELPATTAASTGDVLGLVGEAKIPGWVKPYNLNYSTTEVATGQTWTDGRDVYFKVIENTIGTEEDLNISLVADKLIMVEGITVNPSSGKSFDMDHYISWEFLNNVLTIKKTTYVNNFTMLLWYVKATPEPTVTRKKTTKKGE